MNKARVDEILQFALAVAGEEEPGRRTLGAIHLLKYVYLADLEFAHFNKGETFTGVQWKFHHFGPWAQEVHARIEPALIAIQADQKTFESRKYEKDTVRWGLDEEEVEPLLERLDKSLPIRISSAVRNAVHEFSSDTESLLHHVYRTYPMLRAAPEEILDFVPDVPEELARESRQSDGSTLTSGQKKKLRELQERVRARLNESSQRKLVAPSPAPRYDEVYQEGQKSLDLLAGEPIAEESGLLTFSGDVWKSPGRGDPGVS